MFFSWLTRRRRRKLTATPIPLAWREILQRNVPYYRCLPEPEQRKLEALTQVFVAEKNWEGCGGLAMNEEIKVTVAGTASVLLLGLKRHDYFGRVLSVLVYPSGYTAPVREPLLESGLAGYYIEDHEDRLGEATRDGAVVLAWDAIQEDARAPGEGHNLVWHEFAHQLDMQDRHVDGVPPLGDRQLEARWQQIMAREHRQLIRSHRRGQPTLLDPYGAKDEAEFFAVVSECFFDLPAELQREHAEMYRLLCDYYGQDPGAESGQPHVNG